MAGEFIAINPIEETAETMSTVTELLDPVAQAHEARETAIAALGKEFEELHEALNSEYREHDREINKRREAIYTAHDLACSEVHDTYRKTMKALQGRDD